MRRPSSACQHQLRGYSTRPRRLRLRCQRSAASAAGKGSGWQAVAGGGRQWQAVAGGGSGPSVAESGRPRLRSNPPWPSSCMAQHFIEIDSCGTTCTTTCITGRPARNSADNLDHVTLLYLLFLLPLACHWPATTPPNSWRACDFSPACPLELHPR